MNTRSNDVKPRIEFTQTLNNLKQKKRSYQNQQYFL